MSAKWKIERKILEGRKRKKEKRKKRKDRESTLGGRHHNEKDRQTNAQTLVPHPVSWEKKRRKKKEIVGMGHKKGPSK
jgi:hypothetical protein